MANRFWIAFGPHTALRMEADEVPDWLNLYCDLHSLNVEQLLGDVLNRFDLTRESGESSSDASTIRVTARARARDIPSPVPSIEGAEIDTGSGVFAALTYVPSPAIVCPAASVSVSGTATPAVEPAADDVACSPPK